MRAIDFHCLDIFPCRFCLAQSNSRQEERVYLFPVHLSKALPQASKNAQGIIHPRAEVLTLCAVLAKIVVVFWTNGLPAPGLARISPHLPKLGHDEPMRANHDFNSIPKIAHIRQLGNKVDGSFDFTVPHRTTASRTGLQALRTNHATTDTPEKRSSL